MKKNIKQILLLTTGVSLICSGSSLGSEGEREVFSRRSSFLNVNVAEPPDGLPAAIPNDGKDDSGAFQAAVDYLVRQAEKFEVDGEGEDRCGTVFVPNGVYEFDHRVKLHAQCLNVAICGETENRTVLRSNNDQGVLDFDFGGPGISRIRISEVTFDAAIAGAGTAISAFRRKSGGYVRGVHIADVTIKGSDRDATGKNYFNTGIRVERFLRVLIDKVKIHGPVYEGDISDGADIFKPRYGIILTNCHTPEISRCRIEGAGTGLRVVGEEPFWPEAGIIRNNHIAFCRNAIDMDHHAMKGTTAGLCVSANTIRARDHGLILRNRKAVFITDNRFYGLAKATASAPFGLTDILLKAAPRVICADNWFEESENKELRTNIKIDSDQIGADKPKQASSDCVLLRNNVFNNDPQHAVVVPASQENTRLLQMAENRFIGDAGLEHPRVSNPWDRAETDYAEEDYLGMDLVIDVVNSPLLEETAEPNDLGDDTAAFQRALDLITQKGAGTLYIPAGVYEISRPLTVDADRVRLNIVGDGLQVTRLAFSAAAGDALHIEATQSDSKVVVKGIRFYPRNPVDGAALNIRLNPEGNTIDSTLLIKDILIEEVLGKTSGRDGSSFRQAYFKTGLEAYGANHPIVHSLTVRGYRNKAIVFTDAMIAALENYGCTGIRLANCLRPRIISSYIWAHNQGMFFDACPGLVVVASTSVSCNESMVLKDSPGSVFQLDHVNGYKRNYIIANSGSSVLDEELVYPLGLKVSGEKTKDFRDIEVIASDNVKVVNSIFWHTFTDTRNAVVADGNSKDIHVVGNIFKHGSKDGPVIIGAVTPGTRVDINNHNGFPPSDLKNSQVPVFGYWRMNELIRDGQRLYVPDEDAFNPGRDNNLTVAGGFLTNGHYRAWYPEGEKAVEQDFGQGLFFSGDAYAVSEKEWEGGSDLEVELYVRPHRRVKKTHTLVSCPDVFSLGLEDEKAVFRFKGRRTGWQPPLSLPLKRGRYKWYYIRAVLDSSAGKVWIEISPYTVDGREGADVGLKKICLRDLGSVRLNSSRNPIFVGAADGKGSDPLQRGIIDHLYIRGSEPGR